MNIKALRLSNNRWAEDWILQKSPVKRPWMDELPRSYKCLPMIVVNQWGWQICCPTDIKATWDGNPKRESLLIEISNPFKSSVKSQFGGGILTFSPPWLFRTSLNWDIYVKGPNNSWKENCAPIEGIIETWWINYTFTLNWKIMKPGTVTFLKGEPIAQIFPVPHGTFKNIQATEAYLKLEEPHTAKEMQKLAIDRIRRIHMEPDNLSNDVYMKAENVEDHTIKVNVPEFNKIVP